MATKTRVLSALSNSEFANKLYHKLPPRKYIKIPDALAKHHYPSSLIKLLPNTYCDFGVVTELLLREEEITIHTLKNIIQHNYNIIIPDKTLKLMTTTRYINSVIATKNLLDSLTQDEERLYNTVVSDDNCEIEGHPDLISNNQIFEIKTSGKIKDSWKMFLLQVFTYAALTNDIKKVHLVLPLQEYIWSFEITDSSWPKKKEFMELLKSYAKPSEDNKAFASEILNNYQIGTHISKSKSIHGSLLFIEDFTRPYQLFLTKVVQVKINDLDIQQSKLFIEEQKLKLYFHAPYLLNLCIDPYSENDYVVECLIKHMQCGFSIGVKGVVVHVGKQCGRDKKVALENMKQNILRILEHTHPSCPLLLETPAGQGSELLTSSQEFIDFVTSINDIRIGICLDTCHVFATGYNPYEYFLKLLETNYLKLIHFNDSMNDLNSRVDRHAFIGFGKIPKGELINIANTASQMNIPMIIE
jgi:deoxyribonuclease IV